MLKDVQKVLLFLLAIYYMYREYKIVICIAAGRREFMEVLFKAIDPYRSIVDRVDLWLNTLTFEDRNCIKRTAALDPWYNVVTFPDSHLHINPDILWHTVCKFYKFCVDDRTIYVKIDDDIVYVDDLQHFKHFLDFRIDNPDYFLVSANVLNNAILTRRHQLDGHFTLESGLVGDHSHDKLGMYNGPFAEGLHRQILSNGRPDLRRFEFDKPMVLSDYRRICINWIAWFGSDFADFDGHVPKEDELWLTTEKTKEMSRPIAVCPDFVVVHLAFGPQHKHISQTRLINEYRRLADLPVRRD